MEKRITPERYELRKDVHYLGQSNKLLASVVYREKDGFKYYDILINLNGRLFVVKPCSFYSPKSLNVYRWELKDIVLDIMTTDNKQD